jgi:hypothetical protein
MYAFHRIIFRNFLTSWLLLIFISSAISAQNEYAENWWNIVNWDQALANYSAAKK